MPKVRGVYRDGRGGWYFKAATHKDPLTGRWKQATRRGFATAAAAVEARRAFLEELETAPAAATTDLTVGELIDQYLADCEAADRLSVKTLFDYRHSTDDYIRPWIGSLPVRDVNPEVVVRWQQQLSTAGGTKNGKPLAPNTVRLARAPLNGAFKWALTMGMIPSNPIAGVPRPRKRKNVPAHWTPDEARHFLSFLEGDRLYPLWAFLLGTGLRVGELVFLRWPKVELERGLVRINEFATVLGHDVHTSSGKSDDATRTIDIDPRLVEVLQQQRRQQVAEQLASSRYEESDLVFTKETGGPYHPQYLSRLLGNLSVEMGLPRLTAHGLRHTCATLMLDRGVAPKVAAERLGHADVTLFLNLYSHVTPTMQREAAAQIGDGLFGD